MHLELREKPENLSGTPRIRRRVPKKEQPMSLHLYNTTTRKKEPFEPLAEGRVSMYACGPTVYNHAHIGNLRTYVFEDLLRRVLKANGYEVNHVMNVTDVGHLTDDLHDSGEDKMAQGARREGKNVWEIARFYEDAFFHDTNRLNILQPVTTCRATEHIDEMIALVSRLEEKGFTYFSEGNVYFDISRFPDYGKLARVTLEDLRSGARIEVDSAKRNPHDFVLWFTKSKFGDQTMQWDSPWGRGFPGWHLECSAMSMKYLGESFDIHCGGIDHIPVHHTNEIAQSEAATGKPWVRFWIHGEFLVMDKEKMAKSAGNFITLQTLVDKGYDPLDYRYMCLTANYRTQLAFSWDSLDSARASRASLEKKVAGLAADDRMNRSGDEPGKFYPLFLEQISDDLNAPKGLSVVNSALKAAQAGKISKSQALSEILAMDLVLGLNLANAARRVVETANQPTGKSELLPEEVAELLSKRSVARSEKNWTRSDELRDSIAALGYRVIDKPKGQETRKI